MSQKRKVKNKNIYIPIGVLLLLLLALSFVKKQQAPQIAQPLQVQQLSPTTVTNRYYSEFLKVSFVVPESYEVKDRLSNTITVKNKNGEIKIERINTNFETAYQYINDISKKNRLSLSDKENLNIDNSEAIVVTLNGYNNSDRTYFIYPKQTKWVLYAFSTNQPSLYPDLDQIARSFRYEK